MACETYPDGATYCEDANGWEYWDADGNYSYGSWDNAGNQIDANGLAVTIADTLASIWGGGQRGYYAPNRGNTQPYPQQPINRTGAPVAPGSIGASVSLPKWAIYAGGAVLLGYAFGFIKQGRR